MVPIDFRFELAAKTFERFTIIALFLSLSLSLCVSVCLSLYLSFSLPLTFCLFLSFYLSICFVSSTLSVPLSDSICLILSLYCSISVSLFVYLSECVGEYIWISPSLLQCLSHSIVISLSLCVSTVCLSLHSYLIVTGQYSLDDLNSLSSYLCPLLRSSP